MRAPWHFVRDQRTAAALTAAPWPCPHETPKNVNAPKSDDKSFISAESLLYLPQNAASNALCSLTPYRLRVSYFPRPSFGICPVVEPFAERCLPEAGLARGSHVEKEVGGAGLSHALCSASAPGARPAFSRRQIQATARINSRRVLAWGCRNLRGSRR